MGSPTGPDAPLSGFVDALEQVQVLRDPNSRMMCLGLLEESLGFTLQVENFSTTRMHLFSIVLACRRHRSGLRTLLTVLDGMERESPAVSRAFQVLSSMEAADRPRHAEGVRAVDGEFVADLLSDRDRMRLKYYHVTCTHVAALYRAAVASPAAEPSGEPKDLADALDHLVRLNARSDGVPPVVVFVEHLARHLDGPSAEQFREWNDQQARKLGVVDQLRSLRHQDVEANSHDQHVEACLVLRIERRGFDRNVFVLTDWRQIDPAGWYPRRGDDFIGTLAEIEAQVADLVEEAEAHWARHAALIRVEFLLQRTPEPARRPVEAGGSHDLPQPLGLRYQVVLRSLERARTHHWHRGWKQRWAKLRSNRDLPVNGTPMTHWCSARPRDLSALERLRVQREELVSLVLSARPARAEHERRRGRRRPAQWPASDDLASRRRLAPPVRSGGPPPAQGVGRTAGAGRAAGTTAGSDPLRRAHRRSRVPPVGRPR